MLRIFSADQMERAVTTGEWSRATTIEIVRGWGGIAALPDMPAATRVAIQECDITELPAMPKARFVHLTNLPKLPALRLKTPALFELRLWSLPVLEVVQPLDKLAYFWCQACPVLTELPDLPAAEFVLLSHLPRLQRLPAMPNGRLVTLAHIPPLTHGADTLDIPAAEKLVINAVPYGERPAIPSACRVLRDNRPWPAPTE